MNKDMIQFFEIAYTAIKQDERYILLRLVDDNGYHKILFRDELHSLALLSGSLTKNNFKYKIAGKNKYLGETAHFDLALKAENNHIKAIIDFKILNSSDCRNITADIKSKTNETDQYIILIVLGGELEEQNANMLEQVDEPKRFTAEYWDIKESKFIQGNVNLYMYEVKE